MMNLFGLGYVSVFLFFYYGQIFPEFREKKMNEVYVRIDTKKELDAIRKNQPGNR